DVRRAVAGADHRRRVGGAGAPAPSRPRPPCPAPPARTSDRPETRPGPRYDWQTTGSSPGRPCTGLTGVDTIHFLTARVSGPAGVPSNKFGDDAWYLFIGILRSCQVR